MAWQRRWRALSDRIESLARAVQVYAATLKASDYHSVQGQAIMPELKRLREELGRFWQAHQSELPPAASKVLSAFLVGPYSNSHDNEQGGATLVVPLALVRSEVEYLLRDQNEEARSVAELAFEHLRRSISVDDDVRRKWQAAFEKGETSCEQLGAVHLLSHGIWAFKVSAARAATDLVFGDPIDRHAPDVERTARALVATEWKLVRNPGERDAKAAEARAQLKLYAGGPLADLALTSTRFVVLVSEKTLAAVGDVPDDEVNYRHIALAVDPDSPSVEARAFTRSGL
jgi:hypothetical protein